MSSSALPGWNPLRCWRETGTPNFGMCRGPPQLLAPAGWLNACALLVGRETFGRCEEPCRNRCDAQAEPW